MDWIQAGEPLVEDWRILKMGIVWLNMVKLVIFRGFGYWGGYGR